MEFVATISELIVSAPSYDQHWLHFAQSKLLEETDWILHRSIKMGARSDGEQGLGELTCSSMPRCNQQSITLIVQRRRHPGVTVAAVRMTRCRGCRREYRM